MESDEGPTGNGQGSSYRSEEGRERIPTDHQRNFGGENHGVRSSLLPLRVPNSKVWNSLQRFKLDIANSVVTQQNAGLASMDTDLVLDLFKRTTDEDNTSAAAKKANEASGPASQKSILQRLEDLPAEDEYQSLDLSSFMSSLGK